MLTRQRSLISSSRYAYATRRTQTSAAQDTRQTAIAPVLVYLEAMKGFAVLCTLVLAVCNAISQPKDLQNCFALYNDVSVTIDVSEKTNPKHEWLIILYALPNGNTTAQTMGKKIAAGVHLNVFAYNDSVALLNGKRVVSDTGGTWYRSRLLLRHLQSVLPFNRTKDDSLLVYQAVNKQVRFYLRQNPEQQIFHTQQVERNGFIQSILTGTKKEEKRYRYYGERAYTDFIE